ncbi:MAG: hypothetical protein P4L83_09185 [Nevskia sp.]|nr:hypothetical protein [Nevskia sp.]
MKTYYWMKKLTAALGVVLAGAILPGTAAAAGTTAPPKALVANIAPATGILTTSGPTILYTFPKINGTVVGVPNGTTAYVATMVVGGVTRTYFVIRPTATATAPAPLLLLLHPNGTSPESMADLTGVAPYVLTQGFWAVMPAAVNGKWGDDPSNSTDADVQFISALIDTLVADGVDATRVYAAGYSNGAFMTERLACELSNKIAAFSIDAATLRTGLESVCSPAVQRPKQYFLGTADSIVPYDGWPIASMLSATATMSFWASQQGCGGTVATTLPSLVAKDKTSVQLTDYTGCTAGGDLRLYTVYGGGHAWPDGMTQMIGVTTQDINATGLAWSFSSQYHL